MMKSAPPSDQGVDFTLASAAERIDADNERRLLERPLHARHRFDPMAREEQTPARLPFSFSITLEVDHDAIDASLLGLDGKRLVVGDQAELHFQTYGMSAESGGRRSSSGCAASWAAALRWSR